MNLRISLGLDAHHRAAAAHLYWQAFGGKLGAVLGPEPRALTYLRRVMDLNRCMAATLDGTLVGIVGRHSDGGSFAGGTPEDFRVVYGWARRLWGLPLLGLVGGSAPPSGALMIDGFSVLPAQRGRGIGTALLNDICQTARANGHSAVVLDVIDTNWRAKSF